MNFKVQRAWRVVSCLVFVLPGCGSPSDELDPQAQVGNSQIDVELTYELYFGDPFSTAPAVQAYLLSMDRQRELDIARCMSDSGLEYGIKSDSELLGEQFVASSPDRAQRTVEGFGLSAASILAVDTSAATLTEVYTDALYGDEGCMAQSGQLRSSVEGVIEQYTPQLADIWQRYATDSRVVSANKDWQVCMSAKGFEFPTVNDLKDHIQSKIAENSLSVEELLKYEVAAALADLDCTEANLADLPVLFQELRAEFDEKYRVQILDELEALKS